MYRFCFRNDLAIRLGTAVQHFSTSSLRSGPYEETIQNLKLNAQTRVIYQGTTRKPWILIIMRVNMTQASLGKWYDTR
jgi:hypothetical protein